MPANLLLQPVQPVMPLAVSEREAARLIGVTPRTLYARRGDGSGPPWRRLGGRILYPIDGLRAWLAGDAAKGADNE
jgi:hypothetical protein